MNILKIIERSFFPRRCELCGEVVELDRKRCSSCETAQRTVGRIVDNKMAYASVVSPFLFKDSVRKGIHNFKYEGFVELAPVFATEMADAVKREYASIDFDAVTYVPLTKKRLRKRGFNQSELLAKEISKLLDVPCINGLSKIRETKSQQGRSKAERATNVKDAFEIANYDVKNKIILLVDDVKTTGSTLNECAKVLKKHKADKVFAVTIAVAKGE